jgi:ATP-dependent DNA helicase RecG
MSAAIRLEDEELKFLFRSDESFRIERKETLSGSAPTTVREAICAFANDLPGAGLPGVIFIGLKDNGQPSGVPITDELLRQLADMKTDGQTVPVPSLLVEKRTFDGHDVAVVTVMPSDSPPVRYKGAIHVRIGPRKGLATPQDERILNERRRYLAIPFDINPLPGVGVEELNIGQFEREYLPNAFSAEVLEANERSMEQRLAATKMISSVDSPAATVLGMLVLGNRPRDFIPGAYVQFLRIAGSELTDPIIDEEAIDGTVSDIMRRLDEKLRAHIRTGVDLTGSDREVRSQSFPLAALQQLARNAIMHRTYEATNAPVRITWFDDRIELLSPGGAYGTVNAQNFGTAGVTDYRNPNLAEAMKVLGYVQRFGVGIATARKQLADAGFPEPEFEVTQSNVLVTVRGARL